MPRVKERWIWTMWMQIADLYFTTFTINFQHISDPPFAIILDSNVPSYLIVFDNFVTSMSDGDISIYAAATVFFNMQGRS